MNSEQLFASIQAKKSFLCVGLDTDFQKLPDSAKREKDPISFFNKQIITHTAPYAIAYKLNIAFYEAMGPEGWSALEKTLSYIPDDVFVIADAKRGDIGNTSRMYARTFFETYSFDAVTVAPYMGSDSVLPFLEFSNKWVFLLALTSNPGAQDFQFAGNPPLFQQVIQKGLQWEQSSAGELGFVVGATREKNHLQQIREMAPKSLLLVPGVGAQGGNLDDVCQQASHKHGGLLINSSRGIIYAGSGPDFAAVAASKAQELQQGMAGYVGK